MDERQLSVTIELIKDYEFRVKFDNGAELLMDEPQPLGGGRGPSASKVLSAAVGNCLSASLLFCLRKARIEPKGLRTTVTTTLTRNEKGRLRVGTSHVTITLEVDPENRSRLSRCIELFEDYCVVTQSVRRGIDVQVEVVDPLGATIYRSNPAEL